MKPSQNLVTVLLILTLCHAQPSYSLPAFPGAEGFGAQTVGGRGGQVIKVTNLNDSGPGSFREAVNTPGPRIVVFEVSGIINLESGLTIKEPFLTIAGQTSPGGILVTGYQTTVNTHEVIIQHMRFRVGSHRIADGANPETLDAFDIWGKGHGETANIMPRDAYNIIIDHSSFSWGVDENFSFAYNPKNITVQWSIISEGLSHAGHPKGEHSKGMLVWGKYSPDLTLSIHHNYFAHNYARNPQINGPNGDSPLVDVTNNVVYNWFGGAVMSGGHHVKINWKHNYAKRGKSSNQYAYEINHSAGGMSPLPVVYVEGNMGTHRTDQSQDHWAVAIGWQYELQDKAWQKTEPWLTPAVTMHTASESLAHCILTGVGATAPVRDSVDQRVIADFAAGTGSIRDNVVFPEDFPTFQNIAAPTDNDDDGMADSWESSNGFNTSADDAAQDNDGDGYTNIEEYLHHLSAKSYAHNPACMPGSRPEPPTNLTVM